MSGIAPGLYTIRSLAHPDGFVGHDMVEEKSMKPEQILRLPQGVSTDEVRLSHDDTCRHQQRNSKGTEAHCDAVLSFSDSLDRRAAARPRPRDSDEQGRGHGCDSGQGV